jgi:hypothetical protein
VCGTKLLGPKTESKIATLRGVPGSVPSINGRVFTECELSLLQSHLSELRGYPATFVCPRSMWYLNQDRNVWANFVERLSWLSFGDNSATIRNALLSIAMTNHGLVSLHKIQWDPHDQNTGRLVASGDTETVPLIEKYRGRACIDLARSIESSENYFEIYCSSSLLASRLMNETVVLYGNCRRSTNIVLRRLWHLSGMLGAMIGMQPSTTDQEWIFYEGELVGNLSSVRSQLGGFLKYLRGYLKPLDLAKIHDKGSIVLSRLLCCPLRSSDDSDHQQIRYWSRLILALYFHLLDPSTPTWGAARSSRATHQILRRLTSVEMQVAYGIHGILENWESGLPVISAPVEKDLLSSVLQHLVWKVFELWFIPNNDWTNVLAVCSQLVTVLDSPFYTLGELDMDLLSFLALFLTPSRRPTGSVSNRQYG